MLNPFSTRHNFYSNHTRPSIQLAIQFLAFDTTYTLGIEFCPGTTVPSFWVPINLSNTAFAAACFASFLDRPVPISEEHFHKEGESEREKKKGDINSLITV